MTENIHEFHVLVTIRKLFLAIFLFKVCIILKQLLFMDVFKYFKQEGKRDCLPDPHGPLNKQLPLSSIEEANKEVNIVARKPPKKRNILLTILRCQSRKPRWRNM